MIRASSWGEPEQAIHCWFNHGTQTMHCYSNSRIHHYKHVCCSMSMVSKTPLCYSLQVSFMLTLRSDSSASLTIDLRTFSPCEVFKRACLKFTVYGHKQARVQCSHASVGLAQVHPGTRSITIFYNNCVFWSAESWRKMSLFKRLHFIR